MGTSDDALGPGITINSLKIRQSRFSMWNFQISKRNFGVKVEIIFSIEVVFHKIGDRVFAKWLAYQATQ